MFTKSLVFASGIYFVMSACTTPQKAPESKIEEQPAPDRIACGTIIGAGEGDYDFRKICVSDKAATATIGAYKSTTYYYHLQSDGHVPNMFYLNPDKTKGKPGNPLTLILKVVGNYKVKSIVDALTVNGITEEGSGGRLRITGQPVPGMGGDEVSFIADFFSVVPQP